MRADLHMHSVYSDGKLKVNELIEYASTKNVNYIALTDHDSPRGINEALEEVKKYGITLIRGIEFSSNLNGDPVHILGYFNGQVPKEITDYSDRLFDRRRKRAVVMCNKIMELYDLKIDINRLLDTPGMITRGNISREILKSNPNVTSEMLFDKYLATSSPAYIPSTDLRPRDIVEMVKRNNGLVVIAHPTLYKKETIEEVFSYDIDGIEAIYPRYQTYDKEWFIKYAKEHNLLITAGSDFHNFNETKHGDIGSVYIDGENLDKFLGALSKK